MTAKKRLRPIDKKRLAAANREIRQRKIVTELARNVAREVRSVLNVDDTEMFREQAREGRWHGAHAAIQALMHAGAIKEQYVLYIREHLAMRKEAVFQINGVAILPPDVPR